MASTSGEARDGREDLRDRCAAGAEFAVTEGRADEGVRRLGSKVLLFDDHRQLGLTLRRYESLPLLVDRLVHGHGVDERLDEIFLVA